MTFIRRTYPSALLLTALTLPTAAQSEDGEPSFRITPKFGVFTRYNEWDNEAGNDADTKIEQTDVGVNFWPHPDVVIKADYQDQDGAKDDDGFNLAIGDQF